MTSLIKCDFKPFKSLSTSGGWGEGHKQYATQYDKVGGGDVKYVKTA